MKADRLERNSISFEKIQKFVMNCLDEQLLITLHSDILHAHFIVGKMHVKKVVVMVILILDRAGNPDLFLGDGDGAGDGVEESQL